jgi:hypothetical protein
MDEYPEHSATVPEDEWDDSDEEDFLREAMEVDGEGEPEAPRALIRAPALLDVEAAVATLPDGVRAVPDLAPRPGRRFDMHAVKFFLTYPRCDVAPTVALGRVMEQFRGNVKWCVVSREQHADGTPHLHVALWLNARFRTRSASFFDFIGGQHGEYQVMRQPVACVRYTIKDGDYEYSCPGNADWTPELYVQARDKRKGVSFETVAKAVMRGDQLNTINQQHPGFVLQHLAKVRAYIALQPALVQPELPAAPGIPPHADMPLQWTGSSRMVLNWLRDNLQSGDRQFGQKQLMVIGGTGIGKTSLVMALSTYYRIYWMPMEESFYDGYSDDAFDLIVMDEYRAQKTIQFMNSFVQGAPCPLRIKGGQQMKRKNLPVVILSNYHPSMSYHKVQQSNPEVLRAFMRRFTVVAVPSDEDLYDAVTFMRGPGAAPNQQAE